MFMGCIVTAGKAEAVVTATGMATEMGKIAGMMDEAGEGPTPLQEKAEAAGPLCGSGLRGYLPRRGPAGLPSGGGDLLEMLLTGVSLAVAAIPEGLPAIVTITLALSVGRILRRGAVIRRLHAVETLGCAGVICTIKRAPSPRTK